MSLTGMVGALDIMRERMHKKRFGFVKIVLFSVSSSWYTIEISNHINKAAGTALPKTVACVTLFTYLYYLFLIF